MPTPAPMRQGSSLRPFCCTSPALRSAAQSDASPRTAQPIGSAARSSRSQAWRCSCRRFEDQNDRSCHSYPPRLQGGDREEASEEIKRAYAPPPQPSPPSGGGGRLSSALALPRIAQRPSSPTATTHPPSRAPPPPPPPPSSPPPTPTP